jgi:hypothetical protein
MKKSSNKIKKLFATVLAAMLLVTTFATTALAAVDWQQTGTLTLVPKYGDTVVSGCTFNLYRVGEVDQSVYYLSFKLTDEVQTILDQEGVILDVNDLQTNAEAQAAAETLAAYRSNLTGRSRSTMTVRPVRYIASGLELGLYLVVQTGAPSRLRRGISLLVYFPLPTTAAPIFCTATPFTEAYLHAGGGGGGDYTSVSVVTESGRTRDTRKSARTAFPWGS